MIHKKRNSNDSSFIGLNIPRRKFILIVALTKFSALIQRSSTGLCIWRMIAPIVVQGRQCYRYRIDDNLLPVTSAVSIVKRPLQTRLCRDVVSGEVWQNPAEISLLTTDNCHWKLTKQAHPLNMWQSRYFSVFYIPQVIWIDFNKLTFHDFTTIQLIMHSSESGNSSKLTFLK